MCVDLVLVCEVLLIAGILHTSNERIAFGQLFSCETEYLIGWYEARSLDVLGWYIPPFIQSAGWSLRFRCSACRAWGG